MEMQARSVAFAVITLALAGCVAAPPPVLVTASPAPVIASPLPAVASSGARSTGDRTTTANRNAQAATSQPPVAGYYAAYPYYAPYPAYAGYYPYPYPYPFFPGYVGFGFGFRGRF